MKKIVRLTEIAYLEKVDRAKQAVIFMPFTTTRACQKFEPKIK